MDGTKSIEEVKTKITFLLHLLIRLLVVFFRPNTMVEMTNKTAYLNNDPPPEIRQTTIGGNQPTRANGIDWTIPSILATIFCFFPTGICAIIAAVHARNQLQSGDTEGGRRSAVWAKALTLTSIGLGVLLYGIIIALYIWVFSKVKQANDEIEELGRGLVDKIFFN